MKKVEKEKIQHYSIRKLSVGAASVLIGLSFMGAHQSSEVKADTIQNSSITQNDKSNVIQQSEDKLDKPMSNKKSEVELSLKDTNEISTQETNNLKLDRKYVQGGEAAPLTAGSSNQNDQESNFETKTSLKTIENKDKSVENNKNKVKTTTLNLNQKANFENTKISLAENKVQVKTQNSSDLATTSEPANLSKDNFAEGTHWTNAGWTSASPDIKVAKSSNFTYDDPSPENLDLSFGYRTLQNGATIKATVDKNDIVQDNKILLASINLTKGDHQQNQNITLQNSTYVGGTENQINFDNQVIGYISSESRNNFEVNYYLNVTNTLNLATDPDISFKLNTLATQVNFAKINDTPIGDAGVDFDNAAQEVGSTYYLVTNSQIIPITISASTISGSSLPKNENDVQSLYADAVVSSHHYYGGVVYSTVSNNESLQGVQKISAVNSKLDPDSPVQIAIRTSYYTIYNDQIYWTTGAPADSPENFNKFASQKIKNVKLANNLSSADVLAQTQPDTVAASYQNDGSYIVAYNISPSTLAAGGKTYVENVVPHETVINNQLRDQKSDAVNQTLDYYQQRNWVPTHAELLIILNTKGSKTVNDVETVTDLTPNSNVPTRIDNYIVNGAVFDGELYKHTTIEYVDDIDETVISKDSITGRKNTNTNYLINIPNGYVLASNNVDGENYRWDSTKKNVIYTFDEDQSKNDNNPIIIRLTHGRKDVVDSNVISEIIHYKYEDGTKAANDYEAKHVVSSRIGHKDLVTGETIWDSDWSTEIFPEVTSPRINGYTADQAKIEAQTVDGNSKDIIRTVVYKANNQKIFIHYVDDDLNGMDLHTDSLIGKSNTEANYITRDTIDSYLSQGYDLVSDETQGKTLKYDADDEHDQIYNIHLKHHISNVTEPKLLNATFDRVVTEKLPDGKQKQFTQHYVITRTGTQDQVTKKYTFGNWSSVQVHEDKGDELDGYTAVIANQNPGNIAEIKDGTPVVKAELFTNSNGVIEPVNISETVEIVYNANDQKATVVFIDDDAPKENSILQTKDLVGKSDTQSNYDPGADVKNYLNKGYELVSDDTKGQPILFDAHDKEDQTFEIHLKHHISDVSDPRILNATFDRVITEHTPEGKDKQITQHYVITRTGTQDQVTKQYKFSDWTVADVHEDKLDSFRGYTAHVNSAKPEDFITIVNGIPTVAKAERFTNENGKLLPKNILETADISYVANPQSAAIVYIDDTADKVLSKVMTTGYYGEPIEIVPNVSSVIEDFVKKGYVLVSNDFNGQKYNADNNQNIFAVHLKHGTRDITRSKDVTETIHYVYGDGSKAHDDYVVIKTFENHGVEDLVTGETMWDTNWTPENDEFAQVNSPEISGYTPDKSSISAEAVNINSKNLEYTVTYMPTSYEPSDPVQPSQPDVSPSTPVIPAQPSVDHNSVKKVNHHSKSQNLKKNFDNDQGNTINKPNDYASIQKVKVVQSGKQAKEIKINVPKSEMVESVKSTTHVKTQLPKTGSDNDLDLTALGLATASLSGLFGLGLRKKKEEN